MHLGIYGYQLADKKYGIFKALVELLRARNLPYIYGPDVLADASEMSQPPADNYDHLKTVDFIITLGGDGTILNAVSLIGNACTPIIGVNLGRLGFLASLDADRLGEALDDLMADRYSLEFRSMLALDSNIPIFENAPFALNDFTLHKRDTSSMITINTFVDDEFLTAYWADGLIVSTPTGSTGYSLSCGGPIIMPNSGNVVITPVAPHNLNVRPIILNANSVISFEIEGRSNAFMCSLDSRFEVITKHHQLSLRKCQFNARLIHFESYSFLGNIRKKLSWGLDSRN